MTDSQDVLHAAILNMEDEESENSKPKPKLANQMWENLGYLEQKS